MVKDARLASLLVINVSVHHFLLGDLWKTRRLEATRGKGRAFCK